MNIVLIDRVRRLRRQVAGRIVQATEDIERVRTAGRYPGLEVLIHGARHEARAHIAIRLRREAQMVSRNEGKAGEVDAETDIVLATMHDTAKRYAKRMPEHPKGKAGKRILRACFRRGLAAVTNVPYEDEVVIAEYIHEMAVTVLADDFRLLGLSEAVDELGQLVPQYRAALAMEERISASAVAAVYEAMQVAWFRLAFGIAALVDDADDQAALLAPVFDQDDRLAAVYAARRGGQSVPDDVDPDAEAEALLEAEAAAARAAEAAAGVEEVRAEVGGDVSVDGAPVDEAPGDEAPGVEAVSGEAPGEPGAGGAGEGPEVPPLQPLRR